MLPTIFTNGDPFNGVQGTVVTAEWLNSVTAELVNVLTAAGVVANGNTSNQLVTALTLRWATLASPAFTGVPMTPTPPPGDSSLKLANTAFLQAALTVQASTIQAAIDAITISPARLYFISQM